MYFCRFRNCDGKSVSSSRSREVGSFMWGILLHLKTCRSVSFCSLMIQYGTLSVLMCGIDRSIIRLQERRVMYRSFVQGNIWAVLKL